MKKTAQYLSTLLVSVGLLAVFFVPVDAKAYTVVRNEAVGFNQWDFSLTLGPSLGAQYIAIGTMLSLTTYASYNSAIATSGTKFFVTLYRPDNATFPDCKTQDLTVSDYALPSSAGGQNNAVYRSFALSGTDCANFDQARFNDILHGWVFIVRDLSGTGQNDVVLFPTKSGVTPNQWFIVSTEATSSVIYQYQQESIGISTSTTAVFCDGTYPGSGIGDTIANAMCTVTGFLFVPSTNVLNSYQTLQTSVSNKIPFSYFFDFGSVLNVQTASSTANFGGFSIDLASTGVGSTSPLGLVTIFPGNVQLLSTTTIMRYVPQSLYDTLFLMARSAIWIAVLFHIYRRIRPKNATTV
jgi:hypothetical protein